MPYPSPPLKRESRGIGRGFSAARSGSQRNRLYGKNALKHGNFGYVHLVVTGKFDINVVSVIRSDIAAGGLRKVAARRGDGHNRRIARNIRFVFGIKVYSVFSA